MGTKESSCAIQLLRNGNEIPTVFILMSLHKMEYMNQYLMSCLKWQSLVDSKDHWFPFNTLVWKLSAVQSAIWEDTGQLCGAGSLLPSFMWVLGIALRWPGWDNSAFNCWANLTAPLKCFLLKFLYLIITHCFVESLQTFKSKASQSGFGFNVLWAEVRIVLTTQFSYCINSIIIMWSKTLTRTTASFWYLLLETEADLRVL